MNPTIMQSPNQGNLRGVAPQPQGQPQGQLPQVGVTNDQQYSPFLQQLMQEFQMMQQQVSQSQNASQQGMPSANFPIGALQSAMNTLGQANQTGAVDVNSLINFGQNPAQGQASPESIHYQNYSGMSEEGYPRVGGSNPPSSTVPSYRNVNVGSGQGVGEDYRNQLQTMVNKSGDASAGVTRGISSF